MQRVLSFPTASRGVEDPGEYVTKRLCCSFILSVGFLALLAGFLLGRFAFDQELELSRIKLRKAYEAAVEQGDERSNVSAFIGEVSLERIVEDVMALSNLSAAGQDASSSGLLQAQLLQSHLKSNGFDVVSKLVQSQIHLSYPNPHKPNKAMVLDGRGKTIIQCEDARTKFWGPIPSTSHNTSTTIQGSIVYVNFGRNEDYHYLDSLNTGVTVSGRVVLVRAGAIPPADIVNIALDHEARGVIIFLDPQQRDAGHDAAQPLLTAVELARLQALHDRQNEFSANESIPVLVISASDAEQILKEMSAEDPSPEAWRGTLKSSYPIGAGFSDPDWTLVMHVNSMSFIKSYYDVLGGMRGAHEPDRYVVLASERDPWLTEERDECGSGALMEVARLLGDLRSQDWRPHRSIILVSWGLGIPEQHDNLQSESWWTRMEMNTVAYLKIEGTDFGNQTLGAGANPLLGSLLAEAAEATHLPVPPLDVMLELGVDQLLTHHGVPFLQFRPRPNLTSSGTGSTRDRLEAITSLWTSLLWLLADSARLPFSLDNYEHFLTHSISVVSERFEAVAKRHALFLESLVKSTERLITRIRTFQKSSQAILGPTQDAFRLRVYNDQLLMFAHRMSCRSDRPEHKRVSARHMIFSRSTTGGDPEAGFGVLQDLLRELTSTDAREDLQRQIVTHVAGLVQCIDAAALSLTDGLDALVAS